MKKISVLFISVLIGTIGTISAQSLSFSGQFGWSIPQGKAFDAIDGVKMTKGGLAYGIDALYMLPILDEKLGAGLTVKGDLLFGSGDFGLSSLSLYGVKGYYKFFSSKVTPYAALSLGLSRYGTPDMTVSDGNGNEITWEGEKGSGFGIMPEVGVQFGGFFIAANYLVPMKYKIEDIKTESVGSLAISIGYRFNIGL
jgi:hypothetical protein